MYQASTRESIAAKAVLANCSYDLRDVTPWKSVGVFQDDAGTAYVVDSGFSDMFGTAFVDVLGLEAHGTFVGRLDTYVTVVYLLSRQICNWYEDHDMVMPPFRLKVFDAVAELSDA